MQERERWKSEGKNLIKKDHCECEREMCVYLCVCVCVCVDGCACVGGNEN